MREGEAVLVIDFKENITLGVSDEEASHDFYGRPQRTIFGAVLIWRSVSSVGKSLSFRYYDVISKGLNHDPWFVHSALSMIFKRESFQKLNLSSLSIWLDNGPNHFRTFETLWVFSDLCQGGLQKITCNYFVEGHGKCLCDTHFSKLSLAVKNWTKQSNHSINTSEELLICFQEMFNRWKLLREQRSQRRTAKGRSSIQKKFSLENTDSDVEFLLMEIPPPYPQLQSQLKVTSFKCFYHFGFSKPILSTGKIFCSVFSGEPEKRIPFTFIQSP